jgi:hypothetical protein
VCVALEGLELNLELEKLQPQCLARRVIVPFYRAKDTIYNAWLTCGLHCILSKGLHHKAHE